MFKNMKFNEKVSVFVYDLDFDGYLLLEELSKYRKFKFNFLVHKLKFYFLQVSFSGRIIEFRCFKKILPVSLDKIACDFRLFPRLLFPYEFVSESSLYFKGGIDGFGFVDLKSLAVESSFRDLSIIDEALVRLKKIFDVELKIDLLKSLSAPSFALKVFSQKFNYMNVNLRLKKSLDPLLREAYFGGRCEVFANTDKSIAYYDFPGMYSICMKERFPFGELRWVFSDEIDLKNLLPGFYTITWESRDLQVPILPAKNEYGKLIFANHEYCGTYWFEEIELFLKCGGKVKSAERALVYDSYNFVFDKFVDYFNSFRAKGGVNKLLAKLVINSLYGKLGSNSSKTRYLVISSEVELQKIIESSNVSSIIELNRFWVIEVADEENSSFVNVGLAAAIASKARIRLANSLLNIHDKNGKILYCDTDSIFIEYNPRVVADASCWFKNSLIYDSGIFIQPKTYALSKENMSEVKIRGVSKPNLSYEEFRQKCQDFDYLFFKNLNIGGKGDFKIKMNLAEMQIRVNKNY